MSSGKGVECPNKYNRTKEITMCFVQVQPTVQHKWEAMLNLSGECNRKRNDERLIL